MAVRYEPYIYQSAGVLGHDLYDIMPLVMIMTTYDELQRSSGGLLQSTVPFAIADCDMYIDRLIDFTLNVNYGMTTYSLPLMAHSVTPEHREIRQFSSSLQSLGLGIRTT